MSKAVKEKETIPTHTAAQRLMNGEGGYHEIGADVTHYPPETLAHLVSIGAVTENTNDK